MCIQEIAYETYNVEIQIFQKIIEAANGMVAVDVD